MREYSPAERLFRSGHFLQSLEALRGAPDSILSLELSYFLGDCGRVRGDARRLAEGKVSDAQAKGRAFRVWAAQLRDDGDFATALEKSQLSVQCLAQGTDQSELALSYCALLEAECLNPPFEGTLTTALLARKSALRSGDPLVLIAIHHTFGKLEARVGNYERALRHFAVARQSLVGMDNPYWEAAVSLDESTTLMLVADVDGALQMARVGSDAATRAGWRKGVGVAAANSAYISVLSGNAAEAERFLMEVERQTFRSTSYDIAVLSTRVRLALLQDNYTRANTLLERLRELSRGASPWYSLSSAETEIKALSRQGRWKEALSKCETALAQALKKNAKPFVITFRLQRAIALAGGQRLVGPQDLPTSVDLSDWPLRYHGSFWLARAMACSDALRAAAHGRRAVRIFEGIGDRHARQEATQLLAFDEAATVEPPTLDSAVALVDVAGHPQILAHEALALIEGTGCAPDVALVARGERTLRVLEVRGWTEREALHAARAAGTETIDCGTLGDDALQIVARPLEELEPRCTWLAIRKLVATGLTLERYRRDEKQRAALWPTESLEGDPDCLWISPAVTEVVRVAKRIGPTPLSVLLTGETGTGKEMLARTIHQASDRADKILLAFNCTAVPRDMLESQLFGYRKGAFTGADNAFTGIIRAAEGGTLFLDEIADMPLDIQPKLLRFLESHEVHPLGESQPVKVDVRVIAATNANLEQQVEDGTFRQDLFYRLNVVRLRLPPLRERREEVPALVEHYVNRYAAQQKKGRLTLTDEALEYLLLYPWPGNLRQLANEVNRMVAMAEPDTALTVTHLSPEIQATRRTIPAAAAPDSELRISLDQSLPEAVELLERTMVQAALDRSKGRLEEAAKLLGISRKGLFLKRRRWGIGSDS